jgi:o-succinylbenzoate---CoA ligase
MAALDDWVSLQARRVPGRPAVSDGGHSLTYAELDAAAARTARRLAALGVGEGDRVATTLPAGLDLAALLHALPRLGAVLVPVNTRLSAGERARVLELAAPRLVVEEPPGGDEAEVELRTTVEADTPHSLLFTSGTTGEPRPVELTFANHAASAEASAARLGVEPDDRWLCPLPLFHVGGLAVLLRSAIYGTEAIVHERFDAGRVRSALESGQATLTSLVPTMLERLRDAGLSSAPALRGALLGGGPIPPGLLDWADGAGIPVLPTYGMTEAASQVATAAPGERRARPLPGVELRIEPDGEILVRGPMVARGALAADGWLHTGDGGRLDEDGFLHVEGRLKELIVTGGENVSPAEVERVLRSHPAVRDAAVVGVPDPEWGEAVTAFVVLGDPSAAEELREHCRARLAAYKVPKRIEALAELPRNAAGKLMRAELPR